MKIRADEHVSPEIVRAVRDMALSPGWEFSSVIEVGDRGLADEHWITRFAQEGGAAIISADTDFLRTPPQVLAVLNTGMRVIHLPPRWASAGCHLQAAHILLWWGRIEATISEMRDRDCYRPPWNINESGELQRVKIHYEQAHKKHRKATRRAGL